MPSGTSGGLARSPLISKPAVCGDSRKTSETNCVPSVWQLWKPRSASGNPRSGTAAAQTACISRLSWNTSKLSEGVEVMIAHCLAHGRRQIVDVGENFPAECRYVLEQLGEVYRIDAVARKTGLSPQKRLQFHQEQSKPINGGFT